MKRLLTTLCLVLLAAAFAPSPRLTAQAIQLRSGEVLFGEVTQAEGDSLTFRRFDNGGVLQLRWDHLSPASSLRLRQSFGLSTDEESEFLMDAEQVEYLLPGGGLRQLVGKRVREDERSITIRSRGQDWVVPRGSLRGVRQISVPVLQVLTNDEFYNEQLAAHAIPAEAPTGSAERVAAADQHILLADVLLRVRDYDRAELHLNRAKELGGGRQPAQLDGKIERLKLFQSAKVERDLIDLIKSAQARGEFERGVELVADFQQKFPNSKLKSEFEKAKERLEQSRERYFVRRIVELWTRAMLQFAQSKTREGGVTLAAARSYAETQMGRDLRAHVAKILKLTPDEVDTLWRQRNDKEYAGVSRAERYAYGIGSWVLGAEAITKGSEQGKANEANKDKLSDEEKEIEKIAKRIAEARRRAMSAGGGQAREYTPEDWWKEAAQNERAFFLRAYYVEYGGDFTVTWAGTDECITCSGAGNIPTMSDTGRAGSVKCPTCQGTRFKRSFRAQ